MALHIVHLVGGPKHGGAIVVPELTAHIELKVADSTPLNSVIGDSPERQVRSVRYVRGDGDVYRYDGRDDSAR